jgi:hypothetical protein
VLKDGMVAEEGNHKELLARGGIYAELHNAQFAPAQFAPAGASGVHKEAVCPVL